jgi:lipoate-protein ligase A
MAVDHAMALHSSPDGGFLRLYEWSEPTVSFGRHEPARGRFGPQIGGGGPDASEPSLHWVRRPTGGRAVLHRGEVTYAVVVPAGAFGGPRGLYRAVNEALVLGLRSFGVDAELAEGVRVRPLDSGPCFDAPAPGEVVAGGGKLVGSAQARIGGALLQHGSILVSSDQRGLGAGSAGVSLSALIGEVSTGDVRDAVEEGFRRRMAGGSWRSDQHGGVVLADAEHWAGVRYGTEEWTWRR